MLIPWPALGITQPAPGTAMKVEAAITSWSRERWMSLSGQPPAAAMAAPMLWHPMQLGDGLAVKVPHATAGAPG